MNTFIVVFISTILINKLSCLDQQTSSIASHSSLSTSYRHNNLFATKTTYHQAYAKLLQNVNQVRDYDLPQQCKPKMFYMICRHSTRYPSKKKINRMNETMYFLRDKLVQNNKLSSDLIRRFKLWDLKMDLKDDNRITDTGFQETRQLAKRIKNDYPIFFDRENTNLKLYTTFKPRTNETAFAFFDEIYKNEPFKPTIKRHLVFHNDCKKILIDNGVELNDPKAIDDLIESDMVKTMRIKVADKIGINVDELDFKRLKLIYIVCSFEFAIRNDTLWCNLLSKEDFHVLEYIIDLQSYLIGGHGREINGRMACPILVDLIEHINESKEKDKLVTSLQFSHSGIFKRIYAMFGLFKNFGSSLCRTSLQCLNEWRSSLILPFLANIKFLMYDCSTSSSPDYRLMVKIQEHFVKIDGCNDFLCSLDDFLKRYESSANQCDLKEICNI